MESVTSSEHQFILDITRTAIRIREGTRVVLARYGAQRPQNLVLDALAETDGLTPGDIAERLLVSGPTAVRMTQRMEANGLVERRRDDPDGRLVRIYITERGREIQPLIEHEIEELAKQAAAGISEKDRRTTEATLAAVQANLGHAGARADAAARTTTS
jgi:MarR family transcriptional regulator, organic hydroperoxide resistance regulator